MFFLPQGSVLGPSLFFFILFFSVISSASNINTAYIMLICYTIVHFLVSSFFSYLRDIHILSSKNNIAKTGLSVTGLPVEGSARYVTLLGRGQ